MRPSNCGYKGVRFEPTRGPHGMYKATVWDPNEKRLVHVGYFATPEEAQREHDRVAAEINPKALRFHPRDRRFAPAETSELTAGSGSNAPALAVDASAVKESLSAPLPKRKAHAKT